MASKEIKKDENSVNEAVVEEKKDETIVEAEKPVEKKPGVLKRFANTVKTGWNRIPTWGKVGISATAGLITGYVAKRVKDSLTKDDEPETHVEEAPAIPEAMDAEIEEYEPEEDYSKDYTEKTDTEE